MGNKIRRGFVCLGALLLGSIPGGTQGPARRAGWSDPSWLLNHVLRESKHENR